MKSNLPKALNKAKVRDGFAILIAGDSGRVGGIKGFSSELRLSLTDVNCVEI